MLAIGHYDEHYYAFCNAPLHLKPDWTRHCMAEIQARMDAGRYEGADSYYNDKDQYWRLAAGLAQKKEHEVNPMNFWFGRQSN